MSNRTFLLLLSCLTCWPLSATAGNVPVVAQGESQSAATNTLEASFSPEGYAALQRLTATFARLDGKRVERHDALSKSCMAGLTPQCSRFVLANREAVTNSIPDNPEYWAAFAAYLASSPAVTRFDESGQDNLVDESIDRILGIEAIGHWPIKQLLTTGKIDGIAAAEQLSHLRRWSLEKTVLLDRMLTMAVLGIHIGTVNAAIASAARTGDADAIEALSNAIAPLSVKEVSLANTFALEAVYGSQLLELREMHTPLSAYETALAQRDMLKELYNHEVPEPQLLSQLELDEIAQEEERIWKASQEQWRNHIVLNELSHDDFWGEADAWNELFESQEAIAEWAYVEYATNARMLALYMQVLRALRDHYVDGQPIVHPSAAAPKHFAWEWRASSDDLCLIPVSVNRFLADRTSAICLPVWPTRASAGGVSQG